MGVKVYETEVQIWIPIEDWDEKSIFMLPLKTANNGYLAVEK